MYPDLNLPKADLRISNNKGVVQVFDVYRKLNVDLTPEEWVRQHVLHFLVAEKNYPQGLIEVEKSIKLFNTDKRVDILVRSSDLKPLLLVECKAPEVKLTQEELNQLGRYQITLNAPLCMLTNGLHHYVMLNSGGKLSFSGNLPSYKEIIT
ncbi:MAG: type I restriction enzyme HsdR N-terminal domain-containing protein [Bacteroidia bacterium]